MADRIAMFEQYLTERPGDRFAMYGLALEYRKVGRFDDAVQAFRALLAAHPDSGAGYYQLGELFLENGRPEDARRAWEEGLAALAGTTDAEGRRSRGEIQGALDDLEDDLE